MGPIMRIQTKGTPDAAAIEADRAELTAFVNLEQLCRWAHGKDPILELDVLTLDEFTHDIVVAVRDDAVLVFDTT